MSKYELYELTDMNGEKWTVLEVLAPMSEAEIDKLYHLYGVDEVIKTYEEGV
jgi:hypothetical protein